jgi:rubrerythrin
MKSPPMGDHFAKIARLEAGAVDAFSVLAQELELLGAPRDIVELARNAATDEVRHAERMGALAQRFGAEPLEARVEQHGPRSLFEIALDNAVEGCVRETFGALVGLHQASAATDPEIAAAMREIAQDETQHAELSWKIAAWAEPMLTGGQRERIAHAREQAVLELRAEMSAEPDRDIATEIGLPPAELAVALVDEMARTIWA